MLLASPQHPVHSEGSTEVKETNDAPLDSLDKIDKSPVLIATVQKDEPVVSRKELWSYYRGLSPPQFHPCPLLTIWT